MASGIKRRMPAEAESDNAVDGEEEETMDASAASSGGGGASSGAGGGGSVPGMHIFNPKRPLKHMNKYSKSFTKHFYFKIYANDWIKSIDETGTAVTGFMTVIPWQALCMYIAPEEYMKLLRESTYCKIKQTQFQLEFKAVRTPFDANGSDVAQANGNLQFELQRWDGLEQMLPFQVVDKEGANSAANVSARSYAELIQRLYGYNAFGRLPTAAATSKMPATMRERGLSWRPIWKFGFGGETQNTASGTIYRDVNKEISSLPIGEYITDRLNTNQSKMGEGYCFNKVYKPKNGIIAMASTAYPLSQQPTGDNTRINMKIRMQDPNTVPGTGLPANPGPNDPQYGAIFPQVAFALDKHSNSAVLGGTFFDVDTSTVTTKTSGTAYYNGSGGSCPTGQNGHPGVCYPAGTVPPTIPFDDFFTSGAKVELSGPATTGEFLTSATNIDAASFTPDTFGYGYQNDMARYCLADLENFEAFTSRNEIPLHHMESMLIGAVPKINVDDSFVNATFEFECTTSCTVECCDMDPTYIQCAYDVLGESIAPPFTGTTRNPAQTWIGTGFAPGADAYNGYLWGGKWQHNELDVLLRDPKYWTKSYGRAGKPLFSNIPTATPTL